MHVLSRHTPAGEDFKILGILFDRKLRMEACVLDLCNEASWKISTILRARRYHSAEELILLYKSQVLSFIEYRTPAIYHACDTVLERVDRLQKRFLREIGMTAERALVQFSLAPLSARRDMAMLGLIHRTVLGKGPSHFRRFFKVQCPSSRRDVTREDKRKHPLQLVDPRSGSHSVLLTRSALGLIGVYNLLPSSTVGECSVPCFQSSLQAMLRARVSRGEDKWEQIFSPRLFLYSHPLRQ